MADFGAALQGFGAGFRGRGSEFLTGLENRRGTKRKLSSERRAAFLTDIRVGNEIANVQNDPLGAARFFGKRIKEINRLNGDPSESVEIMQGLLSTDPNERASAQDFLKSAVNEATLRGEPGFKPAPEKPGFTLGEGQQRFDAQGNVIAEVAPKGVDGQGAKPAGIQEFEALTKDLDKEQVKEAKLIKLGLSARAVGSAIQTIADKDIAEIVGDASAVIKQREKFGEATGASRARAIDKGFETIVKIDTGLRNINKAIEALNQGAGVGAIEGLLPSIRAASKSLDNIQGRMALDVIGAVTFGALSKGELDLAKSIALPTGLDTPELIQHLKDRRAAQGKLRDYFNSQIQFLDQGGTVAGFLRQQEREQAQTSESGQDTGGQTQPATTGGNVSTMSDEELLALQSQLGGASGNTR